MKKYKNSIIAIILSLILVLFIWHKFLVSGNTIIFIGILFSAYYFIKKTLEKTNKRQLIVASIISLLIGIVEIICSSINKDYTLDHILDKWLIINFVGYFTISWSVISNIYQLFDNHELKNSSIKIGKIEIFTDNKISFILNILLIFIAWIPYFLTYYPGLLTSDSYSQVSQAIGRTALTNHHPILHTGIISIFVNTGLKLFNNINIGVALYTIAQMLMMSVMFAIVIKYIMKKQVPLFVRIIVLLYYMFYPVNALFSVIMWKDILFAGIVPIFIILCIELVYNSQKVLGRKSNIALYIIVASLMAFLRNNGIYLVIFTMPFILIVTKKYWKQIIFMFIMIMILYYGTTKVLFNILNIKPGSIKEMLSIPLQQIARVEKHHREELDQSTSCRIDSLFLSKQIGEKYDPILSDPVKAELNETYFNENKVEFIKLWGKLLIKYPKDYIESFISNSYGYYYPEASYWVANRTMEPNSIGLEQTKLTKTNTVSKIDSLIERRDIPLVSMCFSIGSVFWIYVICLGYKISKKDYKDLIACLPIFILWLTIIASPVFCEYRYAYPIFTTIPIYIGLNFIKNGGTKNERKNSSINTML